MKAIKTQTKVVSHQQLENMKSQLKNRHQLSQSRRFVSGRPAWLQYFIDVLALALLLSFLFAILTKAR